MVYYMQRLGPRQTRQQPCHSKMQFALSNTSPHNMDLVKGRKAAEAKRLAIIVCDWRPAKRPEKSVRHAHDVRFMVGELRFIDTEWL
jgi:hypothetical protein